MPDTGLSRSPKLMKGALVQLIDTLAVPTPQIVPFQYNPESVRRDLQPWVHPELSQAPTDGKELTQPYYPTETISISELRLDASDQLEEGNRLTSLNGVADRVAAIENMLYARENPLSLALRLGSQVLGKGAPEVEHIPVTLFVWGVGRIVPVRITRYSIDEEQFLPSLMPLRAKISLDMEVLTDQSFANYKKPSGSIEIAKAAYRSYRAQQVALATAHSFARANELLAILPF